MWPAEEQAAADHLAVGSRGEWIARRWLWVQGCKVIYGNYKPPGGGELDIVCRHGRTLVFVEVKTRTSDAFGRPALAVTPEKQELIMRGAMSWLRMLRNPEIPWRCDVVEVHLIAGAKPRLNWIQAAFNTEELKQTLREKRARKR